MRKSKQLITKCSKTKLTIIQRDKQLTFQLYHQEVLENIVGESLTGEDILQEYELLENVATIKSF